MAFNGSFTIVPPGLDVTTFSITDTSTGSDNNITDRQIFLQLSDGTTLTPSGSTTPYIDFPLSAGDTITLTGILARDYSINVIVNWISSSPLPSPSTYTANELYTFTSNLELFYYQLTQLNSANNKLINDNRYFPNKSKLRVFIDSADNAQTYNDQYEAQLNLDEGYKMQQNKQYLF